MRPAQRMTATFAVEGYAEYFAGAVLTEDHPLGPVEVDLATDGTTVWVDDLNGRRPLQLTPKGWYALAACATALRGEATAAWERMGVVGR